MGIADKVRGRREAGALQTDEKIAVQIENMLGMQVMRARGVLMRVQKLIGESPNGKAAVLTAMGAQDAAECRQIINALRSIVNSHKQSDAPAAPDPL